MPLDSPYDDADPGQWSEGGNAWVRELHATYDPQSGSFLLSLTDSENQIYILAVSDFKQLSFIASNAGRSLTFLRSPQSNSAATIACGKPWIEQPNGSTGGGAENCMLMLSEETDSHLTESIPAGMNCGTWKRFQMLGFNHDESEGYYEAMVWQSGGSSPFRDGAMSVGSRCQPTWRSPRITNVGNVQPGGPTKDQSWVWASKNIEQWGHFTARGNAFDGGGNAPDAGFWNVGLLETETLDPNDPIPANRDQWVQQLILDPWADQLGWSAAWPPAAFPSIRRVDLPEVGAYKRDSDGFTDIVMVVNTNAVKDSITKNVMRPRLQ